MLKYIEEVLKNVPKDWLNLTTHRLDIYNEELAKTQFLEQFEKLFEENNVSNSALNELPTAFDYIRLGHPLSCVLEWAVAKLNNQNPDNVIGFSSNTVPVLAVLRKNALENRNTHIFYSGDLPDSFDAEILRAVYGYTFELTQVEGAAEVSSLEGSTVFISNRDDICNFDLQPNVDFYVNSHPQVGSILLVNVQQNENYISEIQHVRRRESIAMTPANAMEVLKSFVQNSKIEISNSDAESHTQSTLNSIKNITGISTKPLVGSSGLSIQYAILMGLVHDALENHSGKAIKIVVPPNCYGGTNDQARRVAASISNVEIVDLAVDGGNDMVQSIDTVLKEIARQNAVPLIIAEIPTNPRVEVPEMEQLRQVLSAVRKTENGDVAVDPVFILDQTFCPNVQLLGEGKMLSAVRTISFASGSKFPSGGLCTAGYCIGNTTSQALMENIELHLELCDNEATDLQMEILSKQLPSMIQRIHDAYINTRDFVNYINEILPEAKMNFVSEELAQQGFTPSVFSLDLPTKGNSDEEKEEYKRELNLKLINLMINEIPEQSKYCVSYGQLKGCYWTIPATSTQGTTKEGDKDYIIRAALSPNLDLEHHKKVFLNFVKSI